MLCCWSQCSDRMLSITSYPPFSNYCNYPFWGWQLFCFLFFAFLVFHGMSMQDQCSFSFLLLSSLFTFEGHAWGPYNSQKYLYFFLINWCICLAVDSSLAAWIDLLVCRIGFSELFQSVWSLRTLILVTWLMYLMYTLILALSDFHFVIYSLFDPTPVLPQIPC